MPPLCSSTNTWRKDSTSQITRVSEFHLWHIHYILLCLQWCSYFFFFFFYWSYNPLWVLAFSVIFFHSALSLHNILHPLIPIICISSSMSSIHLFLVLPLFLLPVGFHSSTLLGILFPSICITWPSQAILLLFTNLTISAFFIRLFSS